MDNRLCGECKNHYVRGGWHCWSGNKTLGYCRWNDVPHPKAKHWKYVHKAGFVLRSVSADYEDIARADKEGE